MARAGMDTEAVEEVARRLQQQAGQLEGLVGQLDHLVHALRAHWEGRDAEVFAQQVWPQHRASLSAATQGLQGLGQSLLINATDQRVASAAHGGGSGEGGIEWRGAGGRFTGAGPWLGAAPLLGVPVGDLVTRLRDVAGPLLRGESVPLAERSWSHREGESLEAHREGYLGPATWSADGSLFAGTEASARSGVDLSRDGLSAHAEVDARAGVEMIGATSIGLGLATMGASGSVFAGARGSAGASGHLGLDGAEVEVGGRAFAGVEAEGRASVDVGGVEGALEASAWAGVGVVAEGELEVTMDEVRVSLDLGAALGIGGRISPSFSVKPAEVLDSLGKLSLPW